MTIAVSKPLREFTQMLTSAISFGDNVLVRSVPETERLNLAGRTGNVYGETTPSVSGVEVVGVLSRDYAINVHFEDLQQSFWLAEELVALLGHAPGSTITLDGVKKRWVRTESGAWEEFDTE